MNVKFVRTHSPQTKLPQGRLDTEFLDFFNAGIKYAFVEEYDL